jgi:CDP-diacylglycerol---glycerol-3-phosphate 3-phosphatidyltransferase
MLQANGFYGSKGISGLIPDGYTLRESEFEAEVRSHGRSWVDEELPHEEKVFYTSPRRMGGRGIEITEWEREGWTYHAKGQSS